MRTLPVATIWLSAIILLTASAPASAAGAGDFTLVNGTGAAISGVAIRRVGTQEWKGLAAAPAPGASSSVSFKDDDCAFDIRATVAGAGQSVWSGINLCEAKSVTLNRTASGQVWVDYD